VPAAIHPLGWMEAGFNPGLKTGAACPHRCSALLGRNRRGKRLPEQLQYTTPNPEPVTSEPNTKDGTATTTGKPNAFRTSHWPRKRANLPLRPNGQAHLRHPHCTAFRQRDSNGAGGVGCSAVLGRFAFFAWLWFNAPAGRSHQSTKCLVDRL